eukprot:3433296-Rhodomonas_salina.1
MLCHRERGRKRKEERGKRKKRNFEGVSAGRRGSCSKTDSKKYSKNDSKTEGVEERRGSTGC